MRGLAGIKIEDTELRLPAARLRGEDDPACFARCEIEQIVGITPGLIGLQHDEEGKTCCGDIDFELAVFQCAGGERQSRGL
ncbi:hypothetical protein D3C80_1666080 [compost metagenome]